MLCHRDGRKWCWEWFYFLILGLVLGFLSGFAVGFLNNSQAVIIEIYRKGVNEMQKDEATLLIKGCRVFDKSGGVIEWTDGTFNFFPHKGLRVMDAIYYEWFSDYYRDFAHSFFPKRCKKEIKSVCIRTMDGNRIRFFKEKGGEEHE
jgi:hypothetical protein